MQRRASFDGLAGHETDELALIVAVREQEALRRRLRAELLTVEGERVSVRARVHLLHHDIEAELHQRLADLEDGLALLAHSTLDPSRRDREMALALEQRAAVTSFLVDGTPVVDTTIGRPVVAGGEWSLADLPIAMINTAERCHTDFRAALVEAVENVIDSELLVPRRPSALTEPTRSVDGSAAFSGPEFDVAEHDADSVAQVRAFAEDVAMVGRAAEHVSERLRLAVLRRSVEHPRDWLLGAAVRRRRARHALDRSRAVHAALEELRRVAELTE